MALSQSKLAAMFNSPPVATEAEAIEALASGFTDFFADSAVSGSPAVLASLAGAEASFRAAAVGLSSSGQSASRIQAAISAFWATAMASAPTIWVTVPVILPGTGVVPAGLTGIAAALSASFAANMAANSDASTAADAIAAAIFPFQIGATVTLSPPPVGGTPLVPVL